MLISAINLLSEEVRRAAYAGQFHVFPHISANRYSPCSAVRYLYCGYAPQDRSDQWLFILFLCTVIGTGILGWILNIVLVLCSGQM